MGARKMPTHLHAAYDWTAAAGELAELAALSGDALDAYINESAENAVAHDQRDVTGSDLRELATWLREAAVGDQERA